MGPIHQDSATRGARSQNLGPENQRVRIDELAGDLRDYRINGKRSVDDLETPWKLHLKPYFGDLHSLEDGQYEKLFGSCSENWLRAMVEVGRTHGWRVGELLNMRVKQIDLLSRTIRLEPGTTNNHDGREVTVTRRVHELLKLCVFGKTAEAFVFTRSNSQPVRDFRGTWAKACKEAGVPGLLFHDLRRTAARNLRRAGVAEGVIMKIGGWRTRSVFERYAIVSQADIAEALGRLELRGGYSLGHSEPTEPNPDEPATV